MSISPNVGPQSIDIKITGAYFGPAKGKVYVTQNKGFIDGWMIQSWSDKTISACNFTVPSASQVQFYMARVESADGRISQDYPFYVDPNKAFPNPIPCNS